MMWAADFNEDVILHLEENCLEPLLVDMRNDLSCEVKEEHRVNSYTRRKFKSRKPHHRNGEMRVACNLGMKPNTRMACQELLFGQTSADATYTHKCVSKNMKMMICLYYVWQQSW